jgi:Uma2 family endonuclease
MQYPAARADRLRRERLLTRKEFERVADLGIFDGERVELLHGAIVEMGPSGPEHGESVDRSVERLFAALQGRARVRVQGAFAASEASEPQPDVSVLPVLDYSRENPREAWLVIEVAKTSLDDDREKAALYAAAAVEEYWIVNLVEGVLEVHRDPRAGRYANVQTLPRTARVRVAHFPDVEIAVDDLFPSAGVGVTGR